jgi:hypothetical protein
VRAQFDDAMAGLATGPQRARAWWRDLACAAITALAKREGPAATDVYLAAAVSASQAVRDYGLNALDAKGGDLAWDPMLARVEEIIGRKPISYGRWDELLQAVSYLARHAPRGTTRADRLIALVRSNWRALARPPQRKVAHGPYAEPEVETAARLEELLPGIEPDGPPASVLDLPRIASWRQA